MARRAKRQQADTPHGRRVIGYIRVSTDAQVVSGLSIDHQRAQIMRDVERLGYELIAIYEDAGKSGKSAQREGYQTALARMAAGDADVLMYTEGDRMNRNLEDWLALCNMSQFYGFTLYDGSKPVDMASANGFMLAGIKAVVAQAERMRIAERTKAALAAKKAQGIRLGRPVVMDAGTERRILDMRSSGMSLRAIAQALTDEGVPTASGGVWAGPTVLRVIRRHEGQQVQQVAA
jgi:DNA invertase Pin-like site-specific DNA recombinase